MSITSVPKVREATLQTQMKHYLDTGRTKLQTVSLATGDRVYLAHTGATPWYVQLKTRYGDLVVSETQHTRKLQDVFKLIVKVEKFTITDDVCFWQGFTI